MSLKKLKPATLVKTVASAGTAEALASSGFAFDILITAQSDNTGFIYVGGSDVDNTDDPLDAGESISFTPPVSDDTREYGYDLADIYIDSSVSTDGVHVTYSVLSSRS